MECGLKTYSTQLTWLTVLTPADPLTQNFELQVTTNDQTLAGTYTVDIVVAFANPSYLATIIQTLSVTLLHPCKKTIISTTQYIDSLFYTFGDPVIQQQFTEFSDTVSTEYGISGLCALTYSLAASADATNFGVTIQTSLQNYYIQVLTTDKTKMGQTVNLSLFSNGTPQQDFQSSSVPFSVTIHDPCPQTQISFPFVELTSMTNTVTLASVSQTFDLATDSQSTAREIVSLCGPIEYSIVEAYSFIQLTPGTINLGSNVMLNFGINTATLEAKLTNYPQIQSAQVAFEVILLNPCLTTTLTLSTTFVATEITSLSGLTSNQVFAPVTDSAATSANIPDLCGNRIYSIVETIPQGFVTILSPTTNQFTSDWTLSIKSNNFSDVGFWDVTFKAKLEDYSDVPAVICVFSITVLDPCLVTNILPQNFKNMIVNIQDTIPITQDFLPFKDNASVFQGNPVFCGPRLYTISSTFPLILPPASGLVDQDPWQISAMTNDINLIGVIPVTLTVSLTSYSQVTPLLISFNIIVGNNICQTAIVDNKGQTLSQMSFMARILTPKTQNFIPFTDSASKNYLTDSICGPLQYKIVQGYSFVSLISSSSGNSIDPWKISVTTPSVLDFKMSYTITLQAKLVQYPTATAAMLSFQVEILHPCTLTKINAVVIPSMTFVMGDAMVLSQFKQMTDTVAVLEKNQQFCGERKYELINEPSFLTLVVPSDPWLGLFQLTLSNSDKSKIGQQLVNLKVSLINFTAVTINVVISVIIKPKPINNLPFFSPKLVASEQIQMKTASESWSMKLPKIIDLDTSDVVTLTANFGNAANFLKLNGYASIVCEDIKKGGKSNIRSGMYLITFTLDDKKDKVQVSLTLLVIDPFVVAVIAQSSEQKIPEKEDSDKEPVTADDAKSINDTATEPAIETVQIVEETAQEDQSSDGSVASLADVKISDEMTPQQKQVVLDKLSFDWQKAFAKLNKKKQTVEQSNPSYVPVPPTPYIMEITQQGKVSIGFFSEVNIVPNLQMLNNGTIYLDQLMPHRELRGKINPRKMEKVRIPVLQLNVIPAPESNSSDLQFIWNVTQQKSKTMDVQLYFFTPLKVSSNSVSSVCITNFISGA